MKFCALSLAVAAALALTTLNAAAITDSEANASIQFNLSNPGARSLGFGGAFIGLADDATAAYTNPAGLTQLTLPEIALEVRHLEFDTPFVNGGAATLGPPFDRSAVNYTDATSSTDSPGFISAMWPRDRFAIAVYRQQLAKFETDFQASRVDLLDPGRGALRAFDSAVDLDIVNWGASLALRVNDQLALGVGVSYYDFGFGSSSTRFRSGTSEVSSVQVQRGDDTAYGINFGVHYAFSDRWRLGGVYRHGPSFDYSGLNTMLLNAQNDPVVPPTTQSFRGIDFDLPDVAGLGLSFRPQESLTLSLDVVRVEYSDLENGLVSILSNDSAELARLNLDNGYEVRLGSEYTFAWAERTVSLRAGVWSDPNHTLEFEVPQGAPAPALAVLFSIPGERETHYALGAGIAFESFQIDLAADVSDLVDTYSVSGVWHF